MVVRIEECNFIENAANTESAVYAVDDRFDALTHHQVVLPSTLFNVNAERNTLLPGSNLQYDSSDFITGLFHTQMLTVPKPVISSTTSH